MILALVTFRMPATLTREEAAAMFRDTAPKYVALPGLIRKHYVFRALPGHAEAGGCYLWESRAAAEAGHGAEWRARVTAKYGSEPDVRFFEVPVSVDNSGAAPPIAEHPAA
ncbi:YdhR family protein [Rubritepida flocculans]|uniref:YdhR family protein n=1 Tax=Rubritepida flocculans TaxID=182403 RepID=UPI00040E16B1|nr:YdhR family protein [Rubritepida flocculans]